MGMFDSMDFNMNQLPLIGNVFAQPGQKEQQAGFHNMALNYQAYRPEVAQARLAALNNQASMFRPVNAALGNMYGPSAQMDMTQALHNPMSDRMMDLGAPRGALTLEQQKANAQRHANDARAQQQSSTQQGVPTSQRKFGSAYEDPNWSPYDPRAPTTPMKVR